ncbi:sulfite exporter TauE/SafE family protein [Leekyejoonella antrihumi]|uniref:Probable membrane transporter protein n=1 Tax=Leekyejoonella antrihumi TaxID=1660198 RepID=A0A563E176_9MICO|nr:sulfite exporter TauE/SafE family protein [Leekyejoonella antrihumi]TWP35922.1 sulfite exporter TauE/SafE family protein [Leekyejoonella antrihumi]
MTALLAHNTVQLLLVSFGIGIVIGLTGMGGGALMTPALILLGIPPAAAIANDLVAAGLNKSVGAATHLRHGTPHRALVGWLVLGSVPMAVTGSWIDHWIGPGQGHLLTLAIGATLLVTAATYTIRLYVEARRRPSDHGGDPAVRPLPTLAVGAVGGLLVGITSVGSGSLIMVCLLLLYPTLGPLRLVGTDLLQATPLVVAAAIGHLVTTGVNWWVLVPLVIGGSPGTFLGARLAPRIPRGVTRRGIVVLLSLTGLATLGASPTWIAAAAGVLIAVAAGSELARLRPAPHAPQPDLDEAQAVRGIPGRRFWA